MLYSDKIWQKCHPICEYEIVLMIERKVIWGPRLSGGVQKCHGNESQG